MEKLKNGDDNFADLHVHTNLSDGILSPEEVVEHALQEGLKAISITDHDAVDAVDPCIFFAEDKEIEIIPGVELSSENGEREVHILGYYLDHKDRDFLKILSILQDSREERMDGMISLLKKKGMDVTREKVFGSNSSGSIGRLHLARILKEEGFVKSLSEAFDRYIGEGKDCHVKHQRLDYKGAIYSIRKAGGVPTLAHPGVSCKEEDIKLYADAGLKGIEVYHPKHKPAENRRYLDLAQKYGLLVTGGSDCHGGKNKKSMLLGTVRVDRGRVEALRAESERIKDKG
ncbi:MAG: PHP domain-containing protein [Candidatus Omnitrophota bacterium]